MSGGTDGGATPPHQEDEEEDAGSAAAEDDFSTRLMQQFPPSRDPILHWIEPIGVWKWDLRFTTCAICRGDLNQATVVSTAQAGSQAEDTCQFRQCTDVLVGSCDHIFHRFCIENWLRRRHVCPLCNAPWAVKEVKQYHDQE